ncbi:hypothetical protein CRM22_008513 [Opisthorchis felineus]|uniref:Uncharacterized protein n=1 Tax=Opisthorchis felineus TaxID=147828 RepID=A0A4S2LIT0_OPIFE|nr:hypothetical protein CRM22_008513 [Opisthorchis felineus]
MRACNAKTLDQMSNRYTPGWVNIRIFQSIRRNQVIFILIRRHANSCALYITEVVNVKQLIPIPYHHVQVMCVRYGLVNHYCSHFFFNHVPDRLEQPVDPKKEPSEKQTNNLNSSSENGFDRGQLAMLDERPPTYK